MHLHMAGGTEHLAPTGCCAAYLVHQRWRCRRGGRPALKRLLPLMQVVLAVHERQKVLLHLRQQPGWRRRGRALRGVATLDLRLGLPWSYASAEIWDENRRTPCDIAGPSAAAFCRRAHALLAFVAPQNGTLAQHRKKTAGTGHVPALRAAMTAAATRVAAPKSAAAHPGARAAAAEPPASCQRAASPLALAETAALRRQRQGAGLARAAAPRSARQHPPPRNDQPAAVRQGL